jgi:dihydropteroate synthase
MGIVNVTPDSFSDGGRYDDIGDALIHARELVSQGANVIDIGGESTRPGATPISVEQELDRVLPVVEALATDGILVSIDTSKPQVMREAVHAGACLINDVCALRQPGALEAAASLKASVILMHMQGTPRTMQDDPSYKDVVMEIRSFLTRRIEACQAAGLDRSNLLVDPGFGFGKTQEHNCALLDRLGEFADCGAPLVVGISRKSFVRALARSCEPEDVKKVSALLAFLAVERGAAIVRVHDVELTKRFLDIRHDLQSFSPPHWGSAQA